MLRKLLVSTAITVGSLALFAGTASAATLCHPHGQQQHYRQPPVTTQSWCTTVYTPQEPNYSWVENTTGETVTVTLDGNYFWVQTRNGSGPVSYLGPHTTTVTLTPGESISVAWHQGTGEHSWCWTGCCTPGVTVSSYPHVTPPCNPRTIPVVVWTGDRRPCGHDTHGVS
jgi:hypothetical protein